MCHCPRIFSLKYSLHHSTQTLTQHLLIFKWNWLISKKILVWRQNMWEMSIGDIYQKYLDQDKFPKLKKHMVSKMVLFGSTYVCEQLFSKMGFVKYLYTSVQMDEHLENGLQVASTSINDRIWIEWLGKYARCKSLIKSIKNLMVTLKILTSQKWLAHEEDVFICADLVCLQKKSLQCFCKNEKNGFSFFAKSLSLFSKNFFSY